MAHLLHTIRPRFRVIGIDLALLNAGIVMVNEKSVLSFGECLALLRAAMAHAIEKPSRGGSSRIGAVPTEWWQLRLMGNASHLGMALPDEAVERLAQARTAKAVRRKKRNVLAAVYLRTGAWLEDDR